MKSKILWFIFLPPYKKKKKKKKKKVGATGGLDLIMLTIPVWWKYGWKEMFSLEKLWLFTILFLAVRVVVVFAAG